MRCELFALCEHERTGRINWLERDGREYAPLLAGQGRARVRKRRGCGVLGRLGPILRDSSAEMA